jgi:hypothetical protein
VREIFITKLGATCEGGIQEIVKPGTTFVEMWEGGSPPKLLDGAKLAEIAVTSIDGRRLRSGSVLAVPRATWWSVVHEGKRYLLADPDVCDNWAWLVVEAPRAEMSQPVQSVRPAAAVPACPSPKIRYSVYKLADLPPDLHTEADRLVRITEARDSQRATRLEAHRGEDFSRTLALRLYKAAKPDTWDGAITIEFLDSAGKLIDGPKSLVIKNGVGDLPKPSGPPVYAIRAEFPVGFKTTGKSADKHYLVTYLDEAVYCTNLAAAGF